MALRFPPMTALRALEAAARHLSYTRAAEELFVTQSAISHQIKHMEETLGVRLFARQKRGLVLTAEGHALVPVVRDFIRRLTSTLEDFQENSEMPAALRVTLLQAFAFKWLVPRLGHFHKQHPDTDVWISTTDQLVDFDSENADIGIRLGSGDWGDLYREKLFTEYVFPVCSPRFLREHGAPEAPRDLLRYPLLRRGVADSMPKWRDWFREAGVSVKKMPSGIQFPLTSLTVQAAIDDQGVALGRSAYAIDDIRAGRLVPLFPQVRFKSQVSYYMVCTHALKNDARVAAFKAWLHTEAKQSRAEFDAMFADQPKLLATAFKTRGAKK